MVIFFILDYSVIWVWGSPYLLPILPTRTATHAHTVLSHLTTNQLDKTLFNGWLLGLGSTSGQCHWTLMAARRHSSATPYFLFSVKSLWWVACSLGIYGWEDLQTKPDLSVPAHRDVFYGECQHKAWFQGRKNRKGKALLRSPNFA